MDGKIIPAEGATYRKSPWGAVLSLIIAILYGGSPIDLIPDLIPMLGLVDDAVVIPILILLAWSLWRKRKARAAKA